MNKILSLSNIKKSYITINNYVEALKDITFSVNEGEFIALVGPSGCGKSTLLDIIANLEESDGGKIIFQNNTKVGYMFQQDALFPWLSIIDNCTLENAISKNTNNKKYVLELLKKYDLYDFKDKYPSSLSGGMKQRVACIK